MKKEMKLHIGGEKTFSLAEIFSARKNTLLCSQGEWSAGYNINYTFGGYSSMLAILDELAKGEPKRVILVPSYICEGILSPFMQKGFEILFYRIDNELVPDFKHVSDLLSVKPAAVMFIDYMGRSLKSHVDEHLNEYRSANVKVIQDSVHRIDFSSGGYYGDFIFNSFRKTTPFEGSIILSRGPMKIKYSGVCHFRFLLNKRTGQLIRRIHQRFGLFSPRVFLSFIERAEAIYCKPGIFRLTRFSRHMIGRIDIDTMLIKRLTMYQKLKVTFADHMPVSLAGDNYYPYGLFIITERRDEIRNQLNKNGIFCPVHWNLPEAVPSDQFVVSREISDRALTIPFTGIDEKNIDLVINTIKNIIIK
jgi:dTDP-4-amino-4,6-dideoxygalactose transaminase